MNIAKGLAVLVVGMILAFTIYVYFYSIPEMVVAFSVIYLAAVIAAKSSGSNKKE